MTDYVMLAVLVAAIGTSACVRERGSDLHTPNGDSAAQRQPPAAAPDEGRVAEEGKPTRLHVTLTAEKAEAARIEVVQVVTEGGQLEHGGLTVPGQVEFDPHRVALASPRAPGRLERLAAVEGDQVRAGQAVAWIASPEYLTAQADFIHATQRARLLADSPDSAGTAAIAVAAGRRLARLGVSSDELERLASNGEPQELLAVPSPLTGTVMKAHVLAGAAVETGTPLFEVADLSVMDIIAQVPEQSLPLVRPGRRASVSVVAFPGLHIEGAVERLRGGLDLETRTAQAVIHVTNPGNRLRPGMFAMVRLEVPGDPSNAADSTPVVLIPVDAVVNDGENRIVFVEVGERTYERREVRVEPHASGALGAEVAPQLRVREGLQAGERVVSHGAFTLKSELGKTEFGEQE